MRIQDQKATAANIKFSIAQSSATFQCPDVTGNIEIDYGKRHVFERRESSGEFRSLVPTEGLDQQTGARLQDCERFCRHVLARTTERLLNEDALRPLMDDVLATLAVGSASTPQNLFVVVP